MNTSSPNDLWVVAAAGAVTPLGTSLPQTAASLTAKLRRFRRQSLPELSAHPFTVSEIGPVAGQTGPARLLPLLQSALEEATATLPPPGTLRGHTLTLLALPDEFDALTCRHYLEATSATLRANAAWAALPGTYGTVQAGAAGGFEALQDAYARLAHDPELRLAMIIGLDSLVDPARLVPAAQAQWLHCKGNEEGYIAGEAAAAVLLMRRPDVPPGRFALLPPAISGATARLWPAERQPDGNVLQPLLAQALANAGLGTEHISHWLSDTDGSIWRGHEEQNALARIAAAHPEGNLGGEIPELALRLGQVGAAWAPLQWGLTETFARYEVALTNAALCWALDPAGPAGAAAMVCAPH